MKFFGTDRVILIGLIDRMLDVLNYALNHLPTEEREKFWSKYKRMMEDLVLFRREL